ncbi:MAG: HIT family protein [bacterium]
MISFDNYLFVPDKSHYVREKSNMKNCILCSIIKGDKVYRNLIVYKDDKFAITLNLYPYNPGHLMVFPKRHIEDIREMTEDEFIIMHRLIIKAMNILTGEYEPSGFNIGFNIGRSSGASILHLHCHIVPRYKNELGMIDIISGTRIMIEGIDKTYERLKRAFKTYGEKNA